MVKERIEEDARHLVNHEKWRKAHPDAMSGLERQIDSLFNWNAENYKEIGEYFDEWRAALAGDMKQGEGASDIFLLKSCRIASGAMKQLCDEYGQLANILAADPSDKDSYWFDEIRGQNKKACDDARALLMKNIADAAGITDEGLELLTEALKSIYAATDDEDLVDPTPIVNIPKEAKLTLPDYAGIEIRDMKAEEVVNDGHTMSFVGGGDSFVKFANYDDGTGIAVAGNSLCISGTASFGKITIKEHDYGADWQAVRKRKSENR